MEQAPSHIDVDEVRNALLALPHATSVHDLHIWTITSGFIALSAHVSCEDERQRDALLRAATTLLAERFGIRHTTIQIDSDEACEGAHHPSPP
jgi:cobalt-zinc-cadmium efflux system protein